MNNILEATFIDANADLKGMGKCPAWLSREAQSEWQYIVPLLKRLGLLWKTDRATLCAFCSAIGELKRLESIVNEKGETYLTGSGYLRPRPEVAMLHTARQAVRTFAVEFGLTPLSRGKFAVKKDKKRSGSDFLLR